MRFVAGRGAVAECLVIGAAVAERHRENVAGQGAGAQNHREANLAQVRQIASQTGVLFSAR